MEVSTNGGTPIAGLFIVENPIKRDDSGIPPLWETPIIMYFSLGVLNDLHAGNKLLYMYISVNMHLFIHVPGDMCVDMHPFTHTYTHMYIYIYIHMTYVHT